MRVRPPVASSNSIRLYRHSSQSCCPWNVKFGQAVKERAFETRAVIAGKDARTLAADILAMSEDDFRAEFKGSAMKRAKVAGLERNARAVLDRAGQ